MKGLHCTAKHVLTRASFFEVFGTVVVSCAPALFSFWVNIITPSKFYSSLCSRLFSRASPSNSKRQESDDTVKDGLRHRFSPTSPEFNRAYKELPDDGHNPAGKPYTEIYSSIDKPISMENIITKSTTIKQLSE